jgi:hypothetical protein
LALLLVVVPTIPAVWEGVIVLVALIVVAATVLGVVAPSVPFIAAPVSVLFVSVCVLLAVVMFVGVMMDESVAMIRMLSNHYP